MVTRRCVRYSSTSPRRSNHALSHTENLNQQQSSDLASQVISVSLSNRRLGGLLFCIFRGYDVDDCVGV